MAKTMDPAYFVAWRKRMGLTQAQFAAKSGDHLVTVKRWETGARKLPPHIGWIMAAIEHGLEPVGQEAMIEFEGNPRENVGKPEVKVGPAAKESRNWLYKDAWPDGKKPSEDEPETKAKAKVKQTSESKS